MDRGIDDFSISRQSVQWGSPLPWDESQVTYVWVEALMNYVTGIGYPETHEKFWPADVQFMAKDIIKFHMIFWPAILLAAGMKLPKTLFAHGFFSLDGQKMSKSLGNVIAPQELVDEYGVDATRYLLLTQFPFGQDGDIKRSMFAEKYNSDLCNGLGNLVARTSKMIEDYLEGKVELTEDTALLNKVGDELGKFNIDGALGEIWKEIALADKELADNKPWSVYKESGADSVRDILTITVNRIVSISTALTPFMPTTAEKILEQFKADKIVKADGLFPRI